MSKVFFRPESYHIENDKKQTIQNISFQKIDSLTSQIYVDRLDTISAFGAHATEEIFKNADMILLGLAPKRFEESVEVTNQLCGSADKISGNFLKFIKELKDSVGSYKKMERCLKKYADIDQMFIPFFDSINIWFQETENIVSLCEKIFHQNVILYHDIIAYLLAAKQGCKELQTAIRETKEHELVELYQQALQTFYERVRYLAEVQKFTENFIADLKTLIMNHYEFKQKQKHLIKVSIPVFRYTYGQMTFAVRQQVESASEPDDYTAEGIAVRIEILEAQWLTVNAGLQELQWIQKGSRQNHQKNMDNIKALKNDFNSGRT